MRPRDDEGLPCISAVADAKAGLRVRLQAARAAREPDPAGDVARVVRCLAACAGATVVAVYAARPREPQTLELIEALHAAEVRVLLPRLAGRPDWAWYEGPDRMAPGPLGIPQPVGSALGPEALGEADFVWLPGLAGTQDGRRLGTGGGWYDRALGWARTDATRGLLLFDEEVLPEVPVDEWDRPVDLVVTELRRIDRRE